MDPSRANPYRVLSLRALGIHLCFGTLSSVTRLFLLILSIAGREGLWLVSYGILCRWLSGFDLSLSVSLLVHVAFLFFLFLPVKGSSRLFEESGGLRRQKHITVGRLPSSNATHLERKCKKKEGFGRSASDVLVVQERVNFFILRCLRLLKGLHCKATHAFATAFPPATCHAAITTHR